MNTYGANPAAGLSWLQKAILSWCYTYLEEEADFLYPPDAVPWDERPSFYDKRANERSRLFGWRADFSDKERAAVSRALRRLDERGLVTVERGWSSKARYVRLTEIGNQVAGQLVVEVSQNG